MTDSRSPSDHSKSLTYRDSGVDIDAGNEVVGRIQADVRATYDAHVMSESHGAFGGFFQLFGGPRRLERMQQPVLVGATDGVGTKLEVAFRTGVFDTVGIDLVAMSVNDLAVSGAQPLFFLDYIGTGKLEPSVVADVVSGVARACREVDCALLGGETAELPGLYRDGEFDLAGSAVGIVDRARIVDGRRVATGDVVLGLPSSGLHSNGFSLARRALIPNATAEELDEQPDVLRGASIGETLLTPTRLYCGAVAALSDSAPEDAPCAHALSHITGGGLVENIPRILPKGCSVELDPSRWSEPPVFDLIRRRGPVEESEMRRVFNLGIGLVIIVGEAETDRVVRALMAAGEQPVTIGRVVSGDFGVRFGELTGL